MPATLVAIGVAIGLILTASLGNIDIIKLTLKLLDGLEKHEVRDVFSGLALIFVGLAIDRARSERRRQLQSEIEAQKLKTLQATMRTVQDIVNNQLNNLLLFEMEVKEVVPSETLDQLDELVQQTSRKLKALGDVDAVREKRLAVGVGILYEQPPVVSGALTLSSGRSDEQNLRRDELRASPFSFASATAGATEHS